MSVLKITEITANTNHFKCAGESFVSLQDLFDNLKNERIIEMEECIILPYYIDNGKRLELYQYEFCCTTESDFENYMLKLTGKKKMDDISTEIVNLRKKCFSTLNDPNKLYTFLDFLFEDEDLHKEIKRVFGGFAKENLYALVY